MKHEKGKTARAGFTLAELLVVIGIIAVLIAILMPALNRARMSADLVKCQSNFRQIHSAITFYANENHGFLPRSSSATLGVGRWGTSEQTLIRLSELLGTKFDDASIDSLSPVFSCVYAEKDGPLVWAPNLVRTVQFHPRAFPGYDQERQIPNEYPQRRISSILKASEKIAFYEGPQIPIWNMCPEPESIFLDGWRWNWGHMYADPPADGDMSRWDQPIETGRNKDAGWWECSMRFRHMRAGKVSMTPVAFFDGHVEARRSGDEERHIKGEVKVRDICINR